MPSQPLLIGTAGLYRHPLNRAEGFFIHQRLMGVMDDHPFRFRHFIGLSALGEAGTLAPLNHVAQVDRISTDFFDSGNAPHRIGIFL